jgi:hypothetical protein
LAIVYQIVQAHEGKVWVRSKLGHGCTFVLRLRRSAEAAAELEPATAQAAGEKSAALGGTAPRLIGEGAHA